MEVGRFPFALLSPPSRPIPPGAGFYTGPKAGIRRWKGHGGHPRGAGPDTYFWKGRKRTACGDAGNAKMKKAFWEPPKKPFSKMFIQRKVISINAGVVPKRRLVAGDIVFIANLGSYVFHVRSFIWGGLPKIVQNPLPLLARARKRGKNLYPALSAGTPRQGYHHFVLSNNPRLDNSPVLWLSKRKSPWTLPGRCLAFQMGRQNRAKMRSATMPPMIHSMGWLVAGRAGLVILPGTEDPDRRGGQPTPAGGTAYDNSSS